MPSNIFWDKICQKTYFDVIINGSLNVILFMFTVLLLTPLNFTRALNGFIRKVLGEDSELLDEAYSMTTPFILVLCNSGIIPQVVFWTTEFMYFETRSEQVLNRLRKYFFFIFVNAIILPITSLENVNSVIGHAFHAHSCLIPNFVRYIIPRSKFFLLYLLTATFVTQAANLVDLPHWFYIWYERKRIR